MFKKVLLLTLSCSCGLSFASSDRRSFAPRELGYTPVLQGQVSLNSNVLTLSGVDVITPDWESQLGNVNKEEIEEIRIEGNTKKIKKEAFRGLAYLKSVTLPQSLRSIGQKAFRDCTSLEEVRFFRPMGSSTKRIKKIGEEAFRGCTALKEFYLSMSVEEIKPRAFYGCQSLERVVLGKREGINADSRGKLSIRYNAFMDCGNLSSIVINDNLDVYVSDTAFVGCGKEPSFRHSTAAPGFKRKHLFSPFYHWDEFTE